MEDDKIRTGAQNFRGSTPLEDKFFKFDEECTKGFSNQTFWRLELLKTSKMRRHVLKERLMNGSISTLKYPELFQNKMSQLRNCRRER